MSNVRRTISLPPAVAARLDREAARRHVSVSAVIADLLARRHESVSYAGLLDDEPELSRKGRAGARSKFALLVPQRAGVEG